MIHRDRLDRLEKALTGDSCPDCAAMREPVVLVEQLVIVTASDAPLPPIPEPTPPPERCPRCGRDWSQEQRIVAEIRLERTE